MRFHFCFLSLTADQAFPGLIHHCTDSHFHSALYISLSCMPPLPFKSFHLCPLEFLLINIFALLSCKMKPSWLLEKALSLLAPPQQEDIFLFLPFLPYVKGLVVGLVSSQTIFIEQVSLLTTVL